MPSFLTLLGKTSHQRNKIVWYLQGSLAKCYYLQTVTGIRSVIQNHNTLLILQIFKIFLTRYQASTFNSQQYGHQPPYSTYFCVDIVQSSIFHRSKVFTSQVPVRDRSSTAVNDPNPFSKDCE